MKRSIFAAAGLALSLVWLPGCSCGKTGGGQNTGNANNSSKDSQITKAVQIKLDADPALKADGIKAKATAAQVQLTGTVKSIADKDRAETIARQAIQPFSDVNAGVIDNIEIADDSGAKTGG